MGAAQAVGRVEIGELHHQFKSISTFIPANLHPNLLHVALVVIELAKSVEEQM